MAATLSSLFANSGFSKPLGSFLGNSGAICSSVSPVAIGFTKPVKIDTISVEHADSVQSNGQQVSVYQKVDR